MEFQPQVTEVIIYQVLERKEGGGVLAFLRLLNTPPWPTWLGETSSSLYIASERPVPPAFLNLPSILRRVGA